MFSVNEHRAEQVLLEEFEGEQYFEERFTYSTPVGTAVRRLQLLGFSQRKAASFYLAGAKEYLDYRYQCLCEGEEEDEEDARREIEELNDALTVENWRRVARIATEEGIRWASGPRAGHWPDRLKEETIANYLYPDDFCRVDDDFGYFGVSDFRYALLEVLLTFSSEDNLVLDYSELVSGGYEEEVLLTKSIEPGRSNNDAHQGTVAILTEGSSDRGILEMSLKLIYPELEQCFSFPDFAEVKVGGGASTVVKTLKALSAMKVPTAVLAILDNDTAAREAVLALKPGELVEHHRIAHLPELDFCRDYPTVGPQGVFSMNVNGLACSIELFAGINALKLNDGRLTPVHWRGYNTKLKAYQGELIDKAQVGSGLSASLRADLETGSRDTDLSCLKILWKHILALASEM